MDHDKPAALAPEVLLYDRLVFPVPATEIEKARWEGQGWKPDEQERLLAELGDLVVSTRWDARDQLKWADEYEKLKFDVDNVVSEAKGSLAYQATRMVLAQKQYPLPPGVDGIDVIAAASSEQRLRQRTGVDLEETTTVVSNFGLRLTQCIAVPLARRDPIDTLKSTVELAGDAEFRQKRSTVFGLQNRVLSTAEPSLENMQELEQATEDLLGYICLMVTPVTFTNAFAIVGLQPGQAVGQPFRGYASRSTSLSALQFRLPAHALMRPPGSSAPTAMYHD
jgi:hypothetical protein